MARRLIGARRRVAWLGLLLVVLLVHAAVTRWVGELTAGWGRAATRPERLAVTFVREVRPTAPPPALATAKPVRKRPKPRPKGPASPVAAASQPTPAEPAASATPPAVADAPSPEAPPALAEAAMAHEAPPAVDAAASAPPAVDWPQQWPASTRLSYTLTGWYRGPVHGQASVEWLRVGPRYQVHLEVSIGPTFAPYIARSMSSDGELTAGGLVPRRYDEETRIAFRAPRQATIRFEPDAVWLPNGRRHHRLPGVQDAASQFVHLTWLFTTEPRQLTPGSTVEVPLALPRSVDVWGYDVLPAEDLRTPFATLPVLQLKPRRLTRPGDDLVFEAWFAPSLLYLPVRIRIHQDAETYADLLIDRPPLQSSGN
jgi:hypothetical protein